MAVAKNRLLLMLYLLDNSDQPLKARQLAAMAGVSERTVKNDMAELRELAMASGVEILTRKGKGYQLQVLEPQLYEPVREQLQIRFSTMNYTKSETVTRTNDIVRRLIVAQNYLTFDAISDQLFLSRRTLQSQLRDVRQCLEAFGLTLRSRPKYGVKVIGDEFQRRLCMLELYEIHYYKAISFLNYDEYVQYFDVDDTERNDIRHIFLRVLRESGIALSDTYTNRIAWYLVLMRNRIQAGFTITMEEAKMAYLRTFEEAQIAADIVAALQASYTGFDLPEAEVLALETILLCWNDPLDSPQLSQRYPRCFELAKELAGKIAEGLKTSWGVDFAALPDYDRLMIPGLIPLLFCDSLNFRYPILGSHVDNNGIRYSPVSEALAVSAAQILEKQLDVPIPDMEINMLAVRFFALIDGVPYPYKKRRVLICSRNGRVASEIIRNRLFRRFRDRWFETVDIYEFYEVRGLNQEDYDCLLLNFPSYSYRYTIPYLVINQIPDSGELNQFFNQVVMDGYQLQPILDQFGWDTASFYPEFLYDGKEAFIHLISYKNGRDYYAVQKMEEELTRVRDFRVVHQTVIIVQSRQYTRRNSFEIYRLAKPGAWEKKEIRYLIYVTADFASGLQSLRFLEQAAHQLAVNQQEIDDLLKTQDLSLLINTVKLCLQAGGNLIDS